MKKFLCRSAFALLALCACSPEILSTDIHGIGPVWREERGIHGVNSVTLATIGELTIDPGETETLTVEGEYSLLPYIETRTWSGMLTIRHTEHTHLRPNAPVRYRLTVLALERVAVSNAGSVDISSLQAGYLSVISNGSGDILLSRLTADRLEVEINSSGSIRIAEGAVGEQTVVLNDSGRYEAGGLSSRDAQVTVNGSGDATLWVTDDLQATLNGSGAIYYYGPLQPLRQVFNSSGEIIPLGEK
jgi:hypothetical protein